MSNGLRYDALLTRDLAAELDRLLRGVRLDAIQFDRERQHVALLTRGARRTDPRPPSLLWQLHPDRGHLTRIDASVAAGARVPLGAMSAIARISAPADERIIEIELAAGDAAPGAARRLIIELVTNQWNAIVLGADERIVAVLRERRTRERTLRTGEPYIRPAAAGRAWAQERPMLPDWMRLLRTAPPGQRVPLLLRAVAYTSPLNVAAILGDADVLDSDDALERSLRRYLDVAYDAPREPAMLMLEGRAQPYPLRTGPHASATDTLLDAFARAAELADALPVAPAAADVALAAVAHRIDRLGHRLQRLRDEASGAQAEATQLRLSADLLLAQLHRVPRGATQVELDDFAGGTAWVALEPTLSPAENATKLYDTARRRARAAARIPALVRSVEQELARLHALAERIRSGTAADDEIARIVQQTRSRTAAEARPLPYRVYRTSSGHEVRVGRGARANDELTFRHSAPNDIWLHARDVAGAHVILRWARADENPPARDILEAAVLAALHSRARTSGTVAVDWTRRKYVRKPRKAGPGIVLPERVKTVFVEPDSRIEERLRAAP